MLTRHSAVNPSVHYSLNLQHTLQNTFFVWDYIATNKKERVSVFMGLVCYPVILSFLCVYSNHLGTLLKMLIPVLPGGWVDWSIFLYIKRLWIQFLGRAHTQDAGSIPSQDTYGRQVIDVSLSRSLPPTLTRHLSPSFFPSLPSSLPFSLKNQ